MNYFFRIVICVLTIMPFASGCAEQKEDIDKVKIMLSWSPGAENAFLYYGIEKGYFKNEKIEIEIESSKGSSMVAQALGGKACQFGFISSDYLVISRMKGIPIRALTTLYHESPVTIYSLAEKGLDKPEKLIGKNIGVLKQSSTYPQYRSMLKNENIEEDSINEINTSGSTQEILGGLIDAAMNYTNYAPATLKAMGKNINEIRVKDYGVKLYGTCIATHDDIIESSPDLVRRFVRALLLSLEESKLHHEEALKSLIKASPVLDQNVQNLALEITEKMIFTEMSDSLGVGYMTKSGWEVTQQTLKKIGQIENEIDTEYFFNKSFWQEYMDEKNVNP